MLTTRRINSCSILIFFLLTASTNKRGFVINGYITGLADSTQLMLTNISNGQEIDSAFVIKGRFTFKGKLNDPPEELRIISGRKELLAGKLYYTDVLIGNEKLEINGDVSDMPLNVNTSGSAIQMEAEQYHKQLYAWNKKLDKLKAKLKSLPDSVGNNERNQALTRMKAMQDSVENWQVCFLKTHFSSYIVLVLYNYRRDFSTDALRMLYAGLSPELKESKYGRSINVQINYPKPTTGDSYYNFEATTPNNGPFQLSTIHDKYILLQFAGTGCYWSHMSMPEIRYLHQKYKDSIYFISYFMDNKKDWLNTTRRDSIGWQSLWSEGFKYAEACNKYAVTGTPTFFLISPGKKIVSTWFGYENGIVEKEIKKALAKIK